MEIDANLLILVSLLVLGSSYTSWRIGVMEGIKRTVEFVDKHKLVDFDDEQKNSS
jgi:hypothetical protein